MNSERTNVGWGFWFGWVLASIIGFGGGALLGERVAYGLFYRDGFDATIGVTAGAVLVWLLRQSSFSNVEGLATAHSKEEQMPKTAASILFLISGVGWLIGGVPVLLHIMASRELPIVFGIRAGSGLIYQTFGIDGVIVGKTLFDILHVLEIVAGFWLWKSLRQGAVLGILTIALGPIFWIGFGLPIPPLYALLTLPVIVAAWKTLR